MGFRTRRVMRRQFGGGAWLTGYSPFWPAASGRLRFFRDPKIKRPIGGRVSAMAAPIDALELARRSVAIGNGQAPKTAPRPRTLGLGNSGVGSGQTQPPRMAAPSNRRPCQLSTQSHSSQSRLTYAALRTQLPETHQKVSRETFLMVWTASPQRHHSAKTWPPERHKKGDRPWSSLSESVLILAQELFSGPRADGRRRTAEDA